MRTRSSVYLEPSHYNHQGRVIPVRDTQELNMEIIESLILSCGNEEGDDSA